MYFRLDDVNKNLRHTEEAVDIHFLNALFKMHSNRKLLFYIVIIFLNITIFAVFLTNKCSLGEHKRFL